MRTRLRPLILLALGTALMFGGVAQGDPTCPPDVTAPYVTVKSLHSFYNTPDPSGSFASAEGGHPRASLLEGADGKLYGTTWTNGPNMTAECDDNDATCPGTIFSLTRSGGSFTVLHAFSALGAHGRNADGYQPVASLVQDSSGYLYGTTAYGGQPGAGPTVQGAGVMFRILPNGTGFEPLYSFCSSSQCADGSVPQGALIQHGDGFFYGATTAGSSTGQGVIYKLATDGSSLTTLHTFSARTDGTNSDGAVPYGSPIFADSSHLWGFTLWGGKYAKGDDLLARVRRVELHDVARLQRSIQPEHRPRAAVEPNQGK